VLICHCFAVNDQRLREAVADGARTVDDVVARCGAGGRCGGCRPLVADLLASVAASVVPVAIGSAAGRSVAA
jgi:NAD(P)H-nitrite reductase large subunit